MAYGHASTDSFVLQLKLNTTQADAEYLDKCMESGWRIYNNMVRWCRRQMASLRQNPEYRELHKKRKSAKPKERKAISAQLSEIVTSYGLTQSGLESFVKLQQHRFSRYIHSQVAQKIADSVWRGVKAVLYGDGKSLHFRRLEDFCSLEGKQNTTGICFLEDQVCYIKQTIPVKRHKQDGSASWLYEEEALKHRVKYCRLIRKPMGQRYHYYVQLVLEGTSPLRHEKGKGRSGLDIGTSTLAVASETQCILAVLGDSVAEIEREQRRILRKMDRSRRAINPDNYHPDGTVKRGRKKWHNSNNYRRLRMRYKVLCAKRAATLKQWQYEMANKVISQCDTLYVEKMNFKGLQRRSKETKLRKDGRFARKKRFGRSIQSRAPAQFCTILRRKLETAGGTYHEVNTGIFRASQYNHETDTYHKKKLSKRHNVILGSWVQRDLYSAFLLMNSDDSLEHADRNRCNETFEQFMHAHNACITDIRNSNTKIPRSFGFRVA